MPAYLYEPHFATECATLIRRALANNDKFIEGAEINSLNAIIKETESDYPSRIESFKEHLAPLCEVTDYIMGNLNVPPKRLSFYFGQPAEENFSPGQILAHYEQQNINLHDYTPAERERLLSAFFQTAVSPSTEEAEAFDERSLADWLDTRDISANQKWTIMQMYRHFDDYLAECRDILAQAEKLYRDKENVWRPVLKASIDEFKAKMEADNGAYLENVYHIKFESEGSEIRPSLAAFNALTLVYFAVDGLYESKTALFHLGYMIDELFTIYSHSTDTAERLYSRFRAISDKRRLEILVALKVKPLCGQEIAELTGLTPATVSHHMNELVSNDFVDIVKEGTRLYYGFSKKGMNKFLNDVNKCFGE